MGVLKVWNPTTSEYEPVVPPFVPAPTVEAFTSDGTWTKPAGLLYAVVEVMGAGGGGGSAAGTGSGEGSCASGGGSGGYARKVFAAADLPASCAVTVGAGGAGGTAGGNGTAGEDSTFAGTGITTVTGGGGGAGLGGSASSTQARVLGGAGGTRERRRRDPARHSWTRGQHHRRATCRGRQRRRTWRRAGRQ